MGADEEVREEAYAALESCIARINDCVETMREEFADAQAAEDDEMQAAAAATNAPPN